MADAVSVIVGKRNPNQKQIIRSTAKAKLKASLADWHGDIQEEQGLQRVGSIISKLIADACQRACTLDRASEPLMEVVWEAAQK